MRAIKYAVPAVFLIIVACGTDFATATPQDGSEGAGAEPTYPPLPPFLLADIPTPVQPTPTPVGWIRPEPPAWTPDPQTGGSPAPFDRSSPPTATPTPFGWVHPDGPHRPTSTPVVIADHGFKQCTVVDEFTIAASKGSVYVPLVHSTAVDYGADWFTPYPAPEFLSSQPDASLKISFPGLIPTAQSEIHIERVTAGEIPPCLEKMFGGGPVWKIEPLDKAANFEMKLEAQARSRNLKAIAGADTHRLLLLTEAAEVKDVTELQICPGEPTRVCGMERRFGYVMLAER